ncbi:hypothetical protein ASE14_16050 [Agromyces sp. Root81]|uniref:TetR/AcrR family transcriptional regulator n=1 Tax=Agromyces sp. Root81 TaxID=1736601 RepID=UPI0006FA678D|nr:TetR/AcrR family transcriptional regulator [Agromyces sp. Root81]KRC59437.1 hypothetical protein ASE14_16050 [Agromyces sp. Root81]
MSVPIARREARIEKREEILRATARLISRRGIRGLRTADVATEAGVSPGLLFYHFSDRDGLLDATLEYLDNAARRFRSVLHTDDASLRESLIRHVVDEIQDVPELVQVSLVWSEFRSAAVYEPTLRPGIQRATRGWTTMLSDAISEGQGRGDIGAGDPDVIAQLLTTLVEGFDGRWATGEMDTGEARRLLQLAAERLIPAP